MTSITWAGPRCVQGLAAILGPQNHTQGRCDTEQIPMILTLVPRHQLESAEEEDNYQGLAFMELYRKCRAEFLVASDLALRAQLTEFRDHKLVRSKKVDVVSNQLDTLETSCDLLYPISMYVI